jgi:general secretion pathway protein M
MIAALPTGRRGRLLALGLALALLAVLWAGVAAPLLQWHRARDEALARQLMLARHMEAIAASLPDLQRQVAATAERGPPPDAVLEGATDAIAGAALQGRLQDMARDAGIELSSAETLPAEQAGAFRRIGLHLAMNADWPVLVHLLAAIEEGTPNMLIDDLQLHGPPEFMRAAGLRLDASFTVIAFRPGTGPASPP